MQNTVSDRPYVPIPPRRGRLWPAFLSLLVPWILRRWYGVASMEFHGVEGLRASLRAGHGILLPSNHCRDEDPFPVAAACRRAGSPCFLMASRHLFEGGRLTRFLLPRAGAFSVHREGTDRAAVGTAVEILENAERPLVIFPEGHITRTNDRLNPLQEGVALIARTAARRRTKRGAAGGVVVHPVALRYRVLGDAGPAIGRLLDSIEARLGGERRPGRPAVERVMGIGESLLALKEKELLGAPRRGGLAGRLAALTDAVLAPLEAEWCGGRGEGGAYERVKRLRMLILADMTEGALEAGERERRWRQLADAYLALQFAHYPPGYLGRDPSQERLLETVEKLEEDLTDRVGVHGRLAVTVTLGEAIPVRPERAGRGGEDPLLAAIEGQWRGMLGLEGA